MDESSKDTVVGEWSAGLTVDFGAALVEAIPDALLLIDRGGIVRMVNEQALDLFGRARSSLVGLPVECLIPPAKAEGHRRWLDEYFRSPAQRAMGRGHVVGVDANGNEIPLFVSLNPIPKLGVLAIARDRRAELAAARTRDELEAVVARAAREWAASVDALPQLILLVDAGGRVVRANRTLERWGLGTVKDVRGRLVHDLLHRDCHDPECRLLRGADVGRDVPLGLEVDEWEDSILSRRIRLERHSVPRSESVGSHAHAVLVLQDCGREARAHRQAQQTQKMEALGRLAGGVAHDFNNLLMAIRGNIQLLQGRLDDPWCNELLADMRDVADAGATLTRQLLAFGRPRVEQEEPVDLGREIDELRPLFRSLLGERVQIDIERPDRQAVVRLERGAFQQILMNLAINARDAMPEGGHFRVRVAESPAAFGPVVRLIVEDTGTGISPEIVPHVFEPFFTTKGPGKGNGLGLATVFTLVDKFGGTIEVDGSYAEGARFLLEWPGSGETPASDDRAPGAPTTMGERTLDEPLTVLVIEDDPALRRLVERLLKQHGIGCLPASSAAEARQLVAQVVLGRRVLLCDIVLPDGDGGQLAAELLAAHRDLGVILMSGHLVADLRDRGLPDGVPILQKPFAAPDLLGALEEALSGR